MSRLWQKTLDLLQTTDKSVPEICVGANLTVGWLMSVKYGMGKRGSIKSPSVDKVERLYEFLSGKKLEV